VSSAAHEEKNEFLSSHFQNEEQETEACTLGMWLFLAQEVMFFGAMFCAYAVYRWMYFDAFVVGSQSLNYVLGGFNTVILLLSSFTAAMAVHSAQTGNNRKVANYLWLTLILGAVFLFIKWTFEWPPKMEYGAFPGAGFNPDAHHYPGLAAFADKGSLQIFFWLYFVMTGMHALHMVIGFGVILWLILLANRNHFGPRRYLKVEFFGLYWHFVDIVWVFLFPMYYLVT